jgi:hypothetical protein
MTTAKSPSIQERSRIIMLQDLMKRGVCRRAVEMLLEVNSLRRAVKDLVLIGSSRPIRL